MDVAFHLHSTSRASYLRSGQPRRRLLGLLRLLADFTQGPVHVFGGVFCYWMLESYLPAVANRQDHNARIQEVEGALRKRWVQECFRDWYWLGNRALTEVSPATDFMVIKNLSPQIAELICDAMQKRDYLECAFNVSRAQKLQTAIYFEMVERWYSIFSRHSVAYFVPYGADDDPIVAWRLRRLGFSDIRRSDDLPSNEDTFLMLMHLMDEEANAKNRDD